MKVKELIKELEYYNKDTEVAIMVMEKPGLVNYVNKEFVIYSYGDDLRDDLIIISVLPNLNLNNETK